MVKKEFLSLLDQLLNRERGSLTGLESLQELEGWDSLAVLGFIALADDKLGITLLPDSLKNCRTLDDLCALVAPRLAA